MRNSFPPERQLAAFAPAPGDDRSRGPGHEQWGDPAEEGEGSLDIRGLLSAIRRRAWLVGLVTLLVAGAATAYFANKAPLYRAQAAVRLADERKQLAGDLADDAVGKLVGQSTDPILSQIQVLESRGMAAEVVTAEPRGTRIVSRGFPINLVSAAKVAPGARADTIDLAFGTTEVTARLAGQERRAAYGTPIEFDSVTFAVNQRPAGNQGTILLRSLDDAISLVQLRIDARPRKTTDVVDVEYTSQDPAAAQLVANTVVRVFQDYSAKAAQLLSVRRRQFVGEQLAQTDSMLANAQTALSDYQSSQQVYGSTERISAEQSGLMELDLRRGEVNADRQVVTRLLAELERSRGTPRAASQLQTLVSSPAVAQNPVVSQLYQQLVQYQRARDSLTTGSFGAAATNPDVVRLNQLVVQTESRLVDAVRSHVQSLDARLLALDDLKQRNAAAMQALPKTQVEEERLKQRVTTLAQLADQLRIEYQKARIAEAVALGQVQVLDLATLPVRPIGTPLPVKAGLAVFVGLFAGIGLVLLLEQTNQSIRSRDDIEKFLRVPSLAIVPKIEQLPGATGSVKRLLRPASAPAAPRGPVAVQGIGRPNGNGRTVAATFAPADVTSIGGEAYRTLRTNLIFSRSSGSLKSIVVTSPSPGDGKTTTSSNLAVAFAHQGLSVVLVDCDLRRPRLHQVFGARQEPGLSQLLVNVAKLHDALLPSAIPGLTIMTAGVLPPNPSELLGSSRMQEVVAELMSSFDLVILDSPPLLATADAAILGRSADGVVLVVRAGTTDRGAAQTAIRQLEVVGARTLGVVLNDPDSKVPSYGRYYEYYAPYGAATS